MLSFESPNGYQITAFKTLNGFGVTYGAQFEAFSNVDDMLENVGHCLRHSLECEGFFDND